MHSSESMMVLHTRSASEGTPLQRQCIQPIPALQHLRSRSYTNQIQLDELDAVLSDVRDGDVSESEAIEQLSQSYWVWTAVDSESKLLLSAQVGPRTLLIVLYPRYAFTGADRMM